MYLFLLNKLIHQNKWRSLFMISFPFLLWFMVVPFVTDTLDESEIPIAWVVEEETNEMNTIAQQIENHPRIELTHLTKREAYRAVQTNEVEAAFLLHDDFLNHIQAGKMNEQITWVRSDKSFFDSFVKEKVASEIMRFALSSKAANDVTQYRGLTTREDWRKVYQHAEQYWEPEPLFQMNFVPYEEAEVLPENENSFQSKGYAALIGFWLWYAWMIFVVLLLSLYKWKSQGIIERLRLHQGSLIPFYIRFYLLTSGFALLLLLMICYLSSRPLQEFGFSYSSIIYPSVIVFAVILMITFSFTRIFKSPYLFLLVSIVYSLLSLFFSFLTFTSDNQSKWQVIFPHTWLYQLIF
ncbi:ABC transporter permease [Salinibacillus kushneri]|nr:ABC transporter permease [Salinibacillus kushneri]